MFEDCAHIHLGPGCLGLGLIVASAAQAGLETHVLSRPGGSPSHGDRFELEVVETIDGPRTFETYQVGSFSCSGTISELDERVRWVLLERPHLLMTTSVTTSALEASQQAILEMLSARQSTGEAKSTTFIAAENDPGPTWGTFRTSLERQGVRVLDNMVNRYCPSKSDTDGVRRVVVDKEKEWVIALPELPVPPPIAVLSTLPHVDVVTDSTAFEQRKLILINGVHLALAIMARDRKIQRMDMAAARPGRDRWVSLLQGELIRVLREGNVVLGDEQAYATRHFESVMRHDDKVGRILRRFKRNDLVPFLEDFQLKLGAVMRVQKELDGVLHPVFQEILDVLHKLLTDLNAFEDSDHLLAREDLWLSEVRDALSLSAYEQMLGELLNVNSVWERAHNARRSWREHRQFLERRSGVDRRQHQRRRSSGASTLPDRRQATRDRRTGPPDRRQRSSRHVSSSR